MNASGLAAGVDVDIAPKTRFGRLEVLRSVPGDRHHPGRQCVCRCSCGKVVVYAAKELRAGRRMSCGGRHPCSVCGRPTRAMGEWSHRRKHRRQQRRAA